MYEPIVKPNQVVCGEGSTVIVTGWTAKQTVERKLTGKNFAAIGSLYSPTRGISPLIRNLLYNPQVDSIVVLNATKEDKNAGGCQALLDFFAHGVEAGKSDTSRDCWVIKSKVTAYIDKEIELSALNKLRSCVRCIEATHINDVGEKVKEAGLLAESGFNSPSLPRRRLTFPSLETLPTTKPGARYGHRIEGKTVAETWVKILHRIKTTGTIRPTGYDGQWQELIDLVAIVTDEPEDFHFPEPNYLPVDREYVKNYLPQILGDAPYLDGVKYTYGQRLRSWFGCDQVEQVINKLITEIDSASAVMSLWDSGSGNERIPPTSRIERYGRAAGDSDHNHGGSPCLNHIWMRVVDGALSLTATFRSNDMFSAWPANAMGLRALQRHIRDEIAKRSGYNLSMAPLITISQSAHIYDDCWENVDNLIKNQYSKVAKNPDYFDHCGNFLISIEDSGIRVEQMTPGTGEVVSIFTGSTAKTVYQQIAAAIPHISAEHAMYLGTELQKAEIAIDQDIKYIQDRGLRAR